MKEIYKQNRKFNLKYLEEKFVYLYNSHLDEADKEYLKGLLHDDPSQRYSAEEALEHAWLKDSLN